MIDLRAEVVATARRMSLAGLAPGTSGNVSARSPVGMMITPTGMHYDELGTGDVVEVDREGRMAPGQRRPSSEWRLHAEIYAGRPDIQAIVHTHSPYATALACLQRPIPPFHYMVAITGGDTIRCAQYATFGSDELARAALEAMYGRKACLLAHHGVVAVDVTLAKALRIATEVETLASQYMHALSVAEPPRLDSAEMARVLAKFATYGQQSLHLSHGRAACGSR